MFRAFMILLGTLFLIVGIFIWPLLLIAVLFFICAALIKPTPTERVPKHWDLDRYFDK